MEDNRRETLDVLYGYGMELVGRIEKKMQNDAEDMQKLASDNERLSEMNEKAGKLREALRNLMN